MASEAKEIENLKSAGYDPVYIWDAQANEEDLDHSHDFDTHLVVLSGRIEIKMDGQSRILEANDEIDIPRNKTHYAKASPAGCRYIVAEKQ